MVFSTPLFVFVFLPITLIVYAAIPSAWSQATRVKNLILLAMSLIFYAWGEGFFVGVMLASCGLNYLGARAIAASSSLNRRRLLVGTVVALNFLTLGYFKYTNFAIETLNSLLGLLSLNPLSTVTELHLPIGISFFTFQAVSYVLDVYWGNVAVQKSIVNLATYIASFPQLVAGPIVRYTDIAKALERRQTSWDDFGYGSQRFVIGLAKKLLLANPMGELADTVFAGSGSLTFATAWVGVLAYSLQIYFDFSGYSDMAIGLGRIFGFHFLENFQWPYSASSIRDFWRRWHISLSSWFRDYLYIPLGGSRGGGTTTIRNLLVVFLATGLWHGAQWTFVLWGLFHGLWLIAERFGLDAALRNRGRALPYVYTFFVVVTGWAIFRSESLAVLQQFLRSMYLFSGGLGFEELASLMTTKRILIMVLGAICTQPIAVNFAKIPEWGQPQEPWREVCRYAALVLLLASCYIILAANSYNPFIYYRF